MVYEDVNGYFRIIEKDGIILCESPLGSEELAEGMRFKNAKVEFELKAKGCLVQLYNLIFDNCQIEGLCGDSVEFIRTSFVSCNFEGMQISSVFHKCIIKHCRFEYCKLAVDFLNSKLLSNIFFSCILVKVSFSEKFIESDLNPEDILFKNCIIDKVILEGVKLKYKDLWTLKAVLKGSEIKPVLKCVETTYEYYTFVMLGLDRYIK